MGRTSTALKAVAQGAFYLAILAFIVSNSVSADFSHDENQFIAPGQLLAYHGLFPYLDYPYTHMPYGALFYAISASASDYDFLAGRLMNSLVWLGCILLMVAISRVVRAVSATPSGGQPSWMQLLWEFALVYVFIHHGPALLVLRAALNHSLATFFSLLAAWFFVRGARPQGMAARAAFQTGACVAMAGLIRFNYASLSVVLLFCWLIYSAWLRQGQPGRIVLGYVGGMLAASLPAIVLAALAPRQFYYGNLVYIRLNTVYYEQLLRRSGMDLATKLHEFTSNILPQPLELVLYAVLVYAAVDSAARVLRRRPDADLPRFGLAGIAIALWMSAFAPTPALLHYFAAPLPFLFVLLCAFELSPGRFRTAARALGALAVLTAAFTSISRQNPLDEIAVLADSSQWPPVQVHELAVSLRDHVAEGPILTLQPMVPMEAGYDAYPFTATGPFSWRTSLLLTARRRGEYEVTSPQELAALLEQVPPEAILVGFEGPNAGFERQDQGGLEAPFSEYAKTHGYEPVALSPPFWSRGLTLWIRP